MLLISFCVQLNVVERSDHNSSYIEHRDMLLAPLDRSKCPLDEGTITLIWELGLVGGGLSHIFLTGNLN